MAGGGGGTDDQTAAEVNYTSDADGRITTNGTITVQAAIDTLENITLPVARTDADIAAQVATWALRNNPTGTAPTVRLGTGTMDATTYLRGDGTWQPPPGSADASILT